MAEVKVGHFLLDILFIAVCVTTVHSQNHNIAAIKPIATRAGTHTGARTVSRTSARAAASTNASIPAATKAPQYQEVCYEHIGCFNNSRPWDNAHSVLPQSPQKIGTQFLLHTRKDPDPNGTYFLDYFNITSLRESRFNSSLPIKFITHGFRNSITTEWPYVMKDELLKKGDMNVITVSWGPGANIITYNQPVANTRVVAAQIKLLIDNMVKLGTNYTKVHLIGHSLGAHTSGHVGMMLRQQNAMVDRITGLDPAEPDYTDHPELVRLDKNDAAFVDVVHTNGAPLLQAGFGMIQPCGHVDFYVNGGESQPDCPAGFSSLFGALSGSGGFDAVACSHSRAHDLFTESINSDCPFTAYPCDDYETFQKGKCLTCGPKGCGIMGYYSDWYNATGKLFLGTLPKPPFCGHPYTVQVVLSSWTEYTKGQILVRLNGTSGVSDWIPITSKDQELSPRARVTQLAVTEVIVGRITNVQVKYIKSGKFFNFATPNLDIHQLNIRSGETGKRYLFCAGSLKTGVPQRLTVSTSGKCSIDTKQHRRMQARRLSTVAGSRDISHVQ